MARRHECANCGRDVRGVPDNERRFEGGKWYCSQSCFLTAESAASRSGARKPSKRRHKWRRRIGWTLGTIVGLFVVLLVVAAFVGTTPKKKNAAAANARTLVAKKSGGRGSAAHPIPKGALAAVGAGWQMKVVSVTWNVSQATLGLASEPLPKGAENVVVKISVKYLAGGSGNSQAVVNQMNAIGAHKAVYNGEGICLGNAEFGDGGISVYSQQSATGTVCFRIASNDAATLKMFVYRLDQPGYPPTRRVWFKLR